MEIHILLAGVEFGPYTDDKARQLLDEGFLSATDPAKRLDETDWVPLVELLEAAPVGATTGGRASESRSAEPAAPPSLDADFKSLAAALSEGEPAEEFHAPLPPFEETHDAPTAESLWSEPEEEAVEAAPEEEPAAVETSAEPENFAGEEEPVEETAPEPTAEAAEEKPAAPLSTSHLTVTRPSFPSFPITRTGVTRPPTTSLPPPRLGTESKSATQSLTRARRAAEKSAPLTSTQPSPPIASEAIKSSFAAALAKTRSLSSASDTAPLPAPPRTAGLPSVSRPIPEPEPEPEPEVAAEVVAPEPEPQPLRKPAPRPTPEPAPAAVTPSRPAVPSAPSTPGRGAAYLTSSIRTIATTAPLAGLTPATARGKKTTVTGSLLAKEALQRAKERSGILPPTRVTTRLAPSADFEPETAPLPRKRTPVVLNRDDAPAVEAPAPAAPARKAIKLTGTISLPGGAGLASTRSASAEAKVSRPEAPTRPESSSRPQPPARPQLATPPAPIRPAQAPENEALTKTSSRKAIKFTGPISLPGQSTQPTPAAARETSPLAVRFTRPGVRRSVPPPPAPVTKPAPVVVPKARELSPSAAETVADLPVEPAFVVERAPVVEPKPSIPPPSAAETVADLPVEPEPIKETPTVETAKPAPVAEKSLPPPIPPRLPAQLPPPPAKPVSLIHPAEAFAAASIAVEEALGKSPAKTEPDLTASGHLASSGSLRITGALRPPPPPRLPVRLSSPSGEASLSSEGTVFEAKPAAPVPEEELVRPPTGKIAVHEMPTEGVKVRSRRLTSKVPLPASPGESIAAESPARRLPPPLPKKIEVSEPVAPPASEAPLRPAAAAETVADPAVEPPAAPETSASPATPAAQSASEAPAGEASAAKPEKVRLRRPVKLELSSRKIEDSGRLTLEAFSKMAKHDLPMPAPTVIEPAPARAPMKARGATADPIDLTEVGTSPVTPAETPREAATSAATAEPAPATTEFSSRKLSEAPALVWSSGKKPASPFPLEWIFYGIIAFGGLALVAIVFLFIRHHASSAPAAETATNAPAASPAGAPVPASVTPPASAAPPVVPASAAPPASVAPGSSNAAPATTNSASTVLPAPPVTSTSPAEDAARQAGAFVSDGILKYQHGDFDGAISAYNQALSLQPKSPEAFFNRGIAKAAKDDPDGAVSDYTQAINIDPNLAPAYYYRGLARHSKLDLDGAISDYNNAIRVDPKTNALVFIDRGLIRMQKDDLDGAIVDSTRALEIDPHTIQAYYDRGLGRLAKGALDGALADMKTYTQLAAHDDVFADYARLYIWLIAAQQGDLADANKALAATMNAGWTAKSDAMVTRIGEFLLGQISEADLIKASASTDALKDQGQRCEAWYFIGMRKLQAGDHDGAVDALQKCVDTQKTDYCEYILAQEQLKRLGSARAASAAPAPRAAPVALPDPGTMSPVGH